MVYGQGQLGMRKIIFFKVSILADADADADADPSPPLSAVPNI